MFRPLPAPQSMNKDKYRALTPPSSRGMSPQWASRGYRQPSEDLGTHIEDEKGEEAYQRCFAEAAKMKPPRVPNAAFYENSPSAMEYLRKRDRELFSQREPTFDPEQRQRNPNYVPPPKDSRRAPNASLSPTESLTQGLLGSTSQAAVRPSVTTAATSINSNAPRTPTLPEAEPLHHFAEPRYHQGQAQIPPMTLEPHFGPTGPGRMLR